MILDRNVKKTRKIMSWATFIMVIFVPPILIPLSSQERYLLTWTPSKESRDIGRAIRRIRTKKNIILRDLNLGFIFTPHLAL
jgi:hypothetical protein